MNNTNNNGNLVLAGIEFINLTPHLVTEAISGWMFPATGVVPRIRMNHSNPVTIKGITISSTTKEEITGLPEPRKNVILIVSGMVLDYCDQCNMNRTDLIAPDKSVRDDKGRIIGCEGFRTTCNLNELLAGADR